MSNTSHSAFRDMTLSHTPAIGELALFALNARTPGGWTLCDATVRRHAIRDIIMARNGLDRSPVHLLHRVGQSAADAFATAIPDLTPRQLAVLLAVAGDEGANQQELADRTGIDRSTMADIVRRLLRKGLLERRRTPEDKRAYAVTLTEEGRRLLRTAEPVAKRVDERLLNRLPANRREAFMAALARIVEAMTPACSG